MQVARLYRSPDLGMAASCLLYQVLIPSHNIEYQARRGIQEKYYHNRAESVFHLYGWMLSVLAILRLMAECLSIRRANLTIVPTLNKRERVEVFMRLSMHIHSAIRSRLARLCPASTQCR
jgi:hypothetical protein